ncbi:MAG: hypothetical protein GX946_05520 [Oligosphaeraceae bacterium]|nr:hypothetical protein [Oligosphaeraceae bacterium]
MKEKAPVKGLWLHRFAVNAFTVFLILLFYWSMNFFLQDIRAIPGPDVNKLEQELMGQPLAQKLSGVKRDIDDIDFQMKTLRERQATLHKSSTDLLRVLELKKVDTSRLQLLRDSSDPHIIKAYQEFLEIQEKIQQCNRQLESYAEQNYNLKREARELEQELEPQKEELAQTVKHLQKRHRLRIAFYQFLLVLPLLGLSLYFLINKRQSKYSRIFWASAIATLAKTAVLMHEYFPTRYSKYVFMVAMILIVAKLLIYFMQQISNPKTSALIKQFRQAYEVFLCPICEYPIRTGPRKYMYWNRSSIRKHLVFSQPGEQEEAYVCPCCGSNIFQKCQNCGNVRASMLPHCRHCGDEIDLTTTTADLNTNEQQTKIENAKNGEA